MGNGDRFKALTNAGVVLTVLGVGVGIGYSLQSDTVNVLQKENSDLREDLKARAEERLALSEELQRCLGDPKLPGGALLPAPPDASDSRFITAALGHEASVAGRLLMRVEEIRVVDGAPKEYRISVVIMGVPGQTIERAPLQRKDLRVGSRLSYGGYKILVVAATPFSVRFLMRREPQR